MVQVAIYDEIDICFMSYSAILCMSAIITFTWFWRCIYIYFYIFPIILIYIFHGYRLYLYMLCMLTSAFCQCAFWDLYRCACVYIFVTWDCCAQV